MDSQPIAKELNAQNAIVDANIAKKPARPVTDADFENNNLWNLYVSRFGTGATYSMKNDGTISLLDTRYNQGKLSRALKNDADNAAYDNLNLQVQDKLKTLEVKVANVVNPAADFVVVELDENNAEDNNQEQPNVEIDHNGAQ